MYASDDAAGEAERALKLHGPADRSYKRLSVRRDSVRADLVPKSTGLHSISWHQKHTDFQSSRAARTTRPHGAIARTLHDRAEKDWVTVEDWSTAPIARSIFQSLIQRIRHVGVVNKSRLSCSILKNITREHKERSIWGRLSLQSSFIHIVLLYMQSF